MAPEDDNKLTASLATDLSKKTISYASLESKKSEGIPDVDSLPDEEKSISHVPDTGEVIRVGPQLQYELRPGQYYDPPGPDEWDWCLMDMLGEHKTNLPMAIYVSVWQYRQPMRIMISQRYGFKPPIGVPLIAMSALSSSLAMILASRNRPAHQPPGAPSDMFSILQTTQVIHVPLIHEDKMFSSLSFSQVCPAPPLPPCIHTCKFWLHASQLAVAVSFGGFFLSFCLTEK